MNIAVVGSRNFNDEDFIYKILDDFISENNLSIEDTTIVSGGARGVDSMAENYADSKGIKKLIFLADWNSYGKKAGYIRNHKIVENSDVIIAFWDGQSRGTLHTINIATNKKIPTHIVSV